MTSNLGLFSRSAIVDYSKTVRTCSELLLPVLSVRGCISNLNRHDGTDWRLYPLGLVAA